MFDVFSDINMKPSEQIREYEKMAGSMFTRELLAGPNDEPLYILRPQAINVLVWINKNILFELPRVKNGRNAQWIGVRIRIATSMLNKLEVQNILTKDICIEYHNRLIENTRRILGAIYTEDLPF